MKRLFFCTTMILTMIALNPMMGNSSPLFQIKNGDPSNLPDRYRSVGIKIGPRTLNTNRGTLITSYGDDSPAQDFFSSNFEVADSYTNLGLQFDYSWRNYNGLSHSLLIDVALGDNFNALFEYSLGWSFTKDMGSKFLSVRPNIGLGFANYGFQIGQIENTTGYIQVNETIFPERYVNITLKSQLFLISPSLDLRFAITPNLHLTGQVAYDIASKNERPTLFFESLDGSASDSKEVDGINPKVTFRDEVITSLPYTAGGLRLSIGAAYTWNRDK